MDSLPEGLSKYVFDTASEAVLTLSDARAAILAFLNAAEKGGWVDRS